jgi:hypothetical protein
MQKRTINNLIIKFNNQIHHQVRSFVRSFVCLLTTSTQLIQEKIKIILKTS